MREKRLFVLLLCVLQVCLLAFLAFVVRTETANSEGRLVREARRRDELQKKIEITRSEIVGVGRHIDMLIALNLESTAFFKALYEFDERKSSFVFVGPHWRETTYREYYQIFLGFRAEYAALNASVEKEKQQLESLAALSMEEELERAFTAKKEFEDHERTFLELDLRFKKLTETVFLGADEELRSVLNPHYLKIANARLEYARNSLAGSPAR